MRRQLAWSTIDIAIRQVVQFGLVLVLVRLVSPEDFGTVALLSIFIGIAELFANCGLPSALIQKASLDEMDRSTVFWFALGAALLLFMLLASGSPWIAAFYDRPVLVPLTIALAGNLVFSSAGSVHMALLVREGRYRRLTIATTAAFLASAAVSIPLALMGYGPFALAGQVLAAGFARAAALWLIEPWRPRLVFSPSRVSTLLQFGGFMLAGNLLQVGAQRLSSLVIGRAFGAVPLGYFTRAETLSLLPPGLMTSIFGRIYFTRFSRVSARPDAVARELQSAVTLLCLVAFPAMLGLRAVAEPMVHLLFGAEWLPVVPFLTILCLAGLAAPVEIVARHAVMGLGRARTLLAVEAAANSLAILAVLAASTVGLLAIAYAVVLSQVLRAAFYAAALTGEIARFEKTALLDPVAIALAAAAMAAFVRTLDGLLTDWPLALRLAADVASGAFLYAGLVLLWIVTRGLVIRHGDAPSAMHSALRLSGR